MVPYLKGIHLTIDVWRAEGDANGFKVIKPICHLEIGGGAVGGGVGGGFSCIKRGTKGRS